MSAGGDDGVDRKTKRRRVKKPSGNKEALKALDEGLLAAVKEAAETLNVGDMLRLRKHFTATGMEHGASPADSELRQVVDAFRSE